MQLHYQVENIHDKEKPWLILINGLFASLQSWDSCIEDLKQYFRVLRYDCRGQGNSPRPDGPYTLVDNVNDLNELITEMNIKQTFLLGLSNGGRIAMSYSQIYPEKVIAQVVADAYDNVSKLLQMKLESWKKANKVGGPTHRFDIAAPWIWGETFLNQNNDLLDFYRKNAHIESSKVIESLIDGALSGELNLKNEPTPTLMLAGDEDLLTPISIHKRMIKNYQNGKFQEVQGGHASLLEYPNTIKDSVIPYLREYL